MPFDLDRVSMMSNSMVAAVAAKSLIEIDFCLDFGPPQLYLEDEYYTTNGTKRVY